MKMASGNISGLITRHYRSLIRTGRLGPGSRLPSTVDLAAAWETHPPVVQSALAPLVKEGLLQRRPGVGTVVLDVPRRLERIGILAAPALMTQVEGAYMRRLCQELAEQLDRDGQRSVTYIMRPGDPSTPAERAHPVLPAELVEKAANRDIQALIVPVSSAEEVALLQKLPVPVAVVTGMDVPFRVGFDEAAGTEEALKSLKAKGCRRLAVIDVRSADLEQQPGICRQSRLHFTHTRQTAAALGLDMRPEWTVLANGMDELEGMSHELFGYRSFRRIWDRGGPRPDCLLVTEDIAARGALLALLHLRVDVPGQLRLAFHQNAGLNMLCPVPATFIEWNVAGIAAALIEQAERLFAGRPVTPRIVSPAIREHQPAHLLD